MKRLIIIFLALLLLLSGCGVNHSTAELMDVQVQAEVPLDYVVPNQVVRNKSAARKIAKDVFEKLQLSSYMKEFKIYRVQFDRTNDVWVVWFGQHIPLWKSLKGGPVLLSHDIFIVIQKEDGKILKIRLY